MNKWKDMSSFKFITCFSKLPDSLTTGCWQQERMVFLFLQYLEIPFTFKTTHSLVVCLTDSISYLFPVNPVWLPFDSSEMP